MPLDHENQSMTTPASERLRLLDFDDLYLLQSLQEGLTVAATAKLLGLTQPAVTQRLRKIERVFAEPLIERVGRYVRLTSEGRAICAKASEALALMHEISSMPERNILTVGARHEVALRWLWPVLMKLRTSHPEKTFNVTCGSYEELARKLESGLIDAMVAPTEIQGRSNEHIEVGEDTNVLTASPTVAARIKTPKDLQEFVLIDLDCGLTQLRHLPAALRTSMRFRDTWTVGSVSLIEQAIAAGMGVGVLPLSTAKERIETGRLVVILPELMLTGDSYRVTYRAGSHMLQAILLLAGELQNKAI